MSEASVKLSDDAGRTRPRGPDAVESRAPFGWRVWLGGIGAFLFALVAFVGFGKLYPTGDGIPYRYLPTAILAHGNFSLDAWPELGEPGVYAVVRDKHGRLASKKPVLPGVLMTPAFPFLILLAALGTERLICNRSTTHRALIIAALATLIALSAAIQLTAWTTWNGDYHAQFDKGWGDESGWVWHAPFEGRWRARRESEFGNLGSASAFHVNF
jgi:hypothetical protein